MDTLKVLAAVLGMGSSAMAATVAPTGYSSTSASSTYPDSGGVELADGIKGVGSFGLLPHDATEQATWVGWQNVDPTIIFTFSPNTTIGSVTLTLDDADGSWGVYVPVGVKITYGATVLNYTVTDPAGVGPVDLTFATPGFLGDTMAIQLLRGGEWTFLSEVTFDSASVVPTPAALPAGLALLGFAAMRRRP